jgi:hypothetical protein
LYFESGSGERYLNVDWAMAKLPDITTMNRNNLKADDFIMSIPCYILKEFLKIPAKRLYSVYMPEKI